MRVVSKKVRESARGQDCTVNDQEERWRPVRGFVGLYEVSNLGRVRSISRYVKFGRGEKLIEGRILAQSMSAGYPAVCLCDGPYQSKRNIHRLVAEAFVPGEGEVVRHLDGDQMNSRAENLAWGSHKDNEADKVRHGTKLEGVSHPNAKVTPDQVRQIRRLHAQKNSQLDIARVTGVNRGTVGKIVRGEAWGSVV